MFVFIICIFTAMLLFFVIINQVTKILIDHSNFF